MSNLMDFAKRELKLLEDSIDKDDKLGKEMQHAVTENVIEVLDVLDKQGHSGGSAVYVMEVIRRLWSWKPLTSLTGAEDEWDKGQNKRCPSVFKDEDGNTYFSNGFAYCEPDDDYWYTCKESWKPITFPCSTSELRTEYRKLKYSSNEVPIKDAIEKKLYEVVKK